ncbi:MAG: small subunit ribosomal protein [Thermotogota bacterium]|nr:small subunit ribosomal protein [Thermotogota bacterium]MDK2864150.1 small subunit ribosomal protein [Thermotogota bacterium]
MARYTGPVCRLCRREGIKLYLKGERCYTEKCALEKRPYPPGQHGRRRAKLTQYAMQLRAKQAMKRMYGILERQFKKYFAEAQRKKGVTGDYLVQIVESRLDNVVFRLGFATSRRQARQLVNHGHFLVNGKKVDIPSYRVRPGDVIEVRPKSRDIEPIKHAVELARERTPYSWLEVDYDELRGTFLRYPERDEIDLPVDVQAIVELYSK